MMFKGKILGTFALCLFAAASSAADRALPDFSGLVAADGPAVVNISTTQIDRRAPVTGLDDSGGAPRGPFDKLLRRYFGEQGGPEYFDSKSLGSGFIISPDGYILTCAHVVENARQIVVKLTDRREFTARVVGVDRRSDVALLKIHASRLPKVAIGDPGRLKVGQWVLAIGSPFGFENSATAGIVSAKGRSLPGESYVPFIQTDVAINPGNSGGPLFNLRGQVVGINSRIYSRTGGFMGLSFAVPIDTAMEVSRQLRLNGRVTRGWIGVTIQDVTRGLAKAFSMKEPYGALVADILPESPAANSALKVGDVVVEYAGERINLSSDLPPLVGHTAPGTRVSLLVVRAGQLQTLAMTVGELPAEGFQPAPAEQTPVESRAVLGLGLANLTSDERRQIGVSHGVMVTQVGSGSAMDAGIRQGDVIVQFNSRAVDDVKELQQLIALVPAGRAVPVLVRRGATALFVAIRFGG
ncbi:MAG: Do family serine endopeptidase [Acidiferrobacterales bacterium]